jgi:hypothetical protein
MDVYFTVTLLSKLLLHCTQQFPNDLNIINEFLDVPNLPQNMV